MDINTILTSVNTTTALAFLGGAGVVGVAAQIIKKVFGLESAKVIQLLVIVLGIAAAGLQYLLSAHNLPATILGQHTAILLGIAQPLYVYVIRPADIFLTKVQAYNASQTPPESGTVSAALDNPGTTSPPTNSETTPTSGQASF